MKPPNQSIQNFNVTETQLQQWFIIQQELSSDGVETLKKLNQFDEISILINKIERVLNCNDSLRDIGESFKELTIYENQRWKDCTVSIKHCRLMVNCLHSVPLNYYSPLEWNQQCKLLKANELQGSRILLQLQASKCQLQQLIEKTEPVSLCVKNSSLLQYLRWLVELLKLEYQIYHHEVEIGNLFEQKCQTYFNLVLQMIEVQSTPFQLDISAINKVYQTMCHDQEANLNIEQTLNFNQQILIETKKTLNHAVQRLKSNLCSRHQKYQNLIESVLGIETCISIMQDNG